MQFFHNNYGNFLFTKKILYVEYVCILYVDLNKKIFCNMVFFKLKLGKFTKLTLNINLIHNSIFQIR